MFLLKGEDKEELERGSYGVSGYLEYDKKQIEELAKKNERSKIILSFVKPNGYAKKVRPVFNTTGKVLTGRKYINEVDKASEVYYPTFETTRAIRNGMVLNLGDIRDLSDWLWMRIHPDIALDKNTALAKKILVYVQDLEKDAIQEIKKKKETALYTMKALGMSKEDKDKLMFILGVSPKGLMQEQIESYILSEVEKDLTGLEEPTIIPLLESVEMLNGFYMLSRALTIPETGVVLKGGLYYCNDLLMGTSKEETLKFLQSTKNTKINEKISAIVEKHDKK